MSVVVPAYNEEVGIAATVGVLHERLEALGGAYEIVVVDNASEDRTVEVVQPLLEDPRVRAAAQRREPRQGLLGPPRDARRPGRAAAALRRRLRRLAGLAAADARGDGVGGRGLRLPRGRGRRRRAPAVLSAPPRRLALHRADPRVDGGAHARRLLRLQAVAQRRRRTRCSRCSAWTAGSSTPRCWRWRAGSAFAPPRWGSTWTDRRGSKLAIREVLIPAVRELLAARRNVRAQARRPRRTDARPAASAAEPGAESELMSDAGER